MDWVCRSLGCQYIRFTSLHRTARQSNLSALISTLSAQGPVECDLRFSEVSFFSCGVSRATEKGKRPVRVVIQKGARDGVFDRISSHKLYSTTHATAASSMMAHGMLPSPPTQPRRVKVYELKNNDWFDRGTGYCTGHMMDVREPIRQKLNRGKWFF